MNVKLWTEMFQMAELKEKFYKRFMEMPARNLQISGRLLQKCIADKEMIIPCDEMNGCLYKFKKRFNISQRVLSI